MSDPKRIDLDQTSKNLGVALFGCREKSEILPEAACRSKGASFQHMFDPKASYNDSGSWKNAGLGAGRRHLHKS